MNQTRPCSAPRPALPQAWRTFPAGLAMALALAGEGVAQDRLALGPDVDVLSILETHCVECHGGAKTKGELDLTTREDLLLGGASGAAVIPGKAEESLLYRMITHGEDPGMPYKRDKLTDGEIGQIAAWIRAEAPYARPVNIPAPAETKAEFAITDADRAHWAFQPVKPVSPPVVRTSGWAKNPIDAFILAGLEAKGLQPAAPASRETLIRRLSLDLIGLPPTPAEIDTFVRDTSPAAYDALIDRLLASPHYGERWGRHWLDLARFAESDGYEHDAVRQHAWRYRDYVVRAFNADKPYDRFVREQLAGDELYPGEPDALIATGFNLLGPDMVDSSDVRQRRHNTLDDMTDTASLSFLGLTMGCARCHDHKFEPIAQRDYFSLQAFFEPAEFHRELPVPSAEERAAHQAAMKIYLEQTKGLHEQVAALEEPYRKSVRARKLGRISVEAQVAHLKPAHERTMEEQNLVNGTAGLIEVKDSDVVAAMSKEDRAKHQALLEQLAPYPQPTLPASLALQNGPPAKTHILFRGEYSQPGEEVAPAFPQVLSDTDSPQAPPPAALQSHRAPLANWLASPDHPLTARVMVNRIWQHHFGRGLVGTPSNFGTQGQKPTHPELLDWLAGQFVANGWSIKHMHRMMLRSATYQQSSAPDAGQMARDPENRYYSRMNRIRLEGEAIRDSLLAISGELNPALGGPGVFPPIPKEIFAGAAGWKANPNPRDYSRRSIYIFARRNLRFPFLEVFDAPDNNLSCPSRDRSTTAPQSLTLLNAEEVLRASELTARRVMADANSTDSRVTLAYRLIIGRAPTPSERRHSEQFLAQAPLHELCRVLFNLNSFVYVD